MSEESKQAEAPSMDEMVKNINDKIQIEVDRAKAIDSGREPPPLEEQPPQNQQAVQDIPQTILVESLAPDIPLEMQRRRNPSKMRRENERLSRELLNLADENERLRGENLQALQVAATAGADQLDANINLAQEAYKQAVEIGDIESQAEAQKFLAQYTAEKALYKRQAEEELQRRYYDNQALQKQNYEAAQYNTTNNYEGTYYAQWLQENPYLDQNSPEYNPELAMEAEFLAKTLNKAASTNRRSHEIGSPNYLNEISGYLRSKYDPNAQYDENYEQPMQPPIPSRQTAPYKAVNKPSANQSSGGYYDTNLVENNYNPTSIRLTRTEEEIALRMPISATKEEKVALYLKEKQKLLSKR